ncbi:helix-turn-helix transcriptional regulator [Streptomyces sp. NPDC001034]|uniref:helix-turn-helix domain-containing protein n=1 Tax=Streptomyces sp. NPDC001034 TaxID=3154375 RepID=UPI00333232F8
MASPGWLIGFDTQEVSQGVNVSEEIRRIRTERRMSQKQLASRIGLNRLQVSRWERGVTYPTLPHLVSLAEALGVSTSTLLDSSLRYWSED